MPYGDISEMQAALDAQFGASHASVCASSHTLHLYTGNPYDTGVEITGPGYAAVTLANDSGWPAADSTASKTRTGTFPAPTGAWDDAKTWVMKNGSAITAWEYLDDTLEVDGAGSGPAVDVTVYVPNSTNVGA